MGPRRSLRGTAAPATPPVPSAPATPGSRRQRKPNSTPRKSQYFEAGDEDDDDDEDELGDSPPPSSPSASSAAEDDDDAGSAYASSSSPSEDDAEPEEDSPTPPPPPASSSRKRARAATSASASAATTPAKRAKGAELWREGVKTGLGPGREVVIRKPRARSPGDVAYAAQTIHPHTMLFLRELGENNDREWLKRNDLDYRASWDDFVKFLECLQEKLMEHDETVPELPIKDVVFRIYRDIRFSKDPTPYKTHFSAAWSRTGRKGPFAGYYMQIKPGGCFVGGGIWMPEAPALAALRRNIDRHPDALKSVLKDARIRRDFLKNTPADDKKAVAAFVAQNAENALKTRPKGFDADHKDLPLLRLRNFTMGAKVNDEEVLGDKGLERVSQLFKSLVPFITFLNSVVMPDEPVSDESGSANGDE